MTNIHTHTCCNRHESYYLQVISVNMTQSYFMNQAKHGCKLYLAGMYQLCLATLKIIVVV